MTYALPLPPSSPPPPHFYRIAHSNGYLLKNEIANGNISQANCIVFNADFQILCTDVC